MLRHRQFASRFTSLPAAVLVAGMLAAFSVHIAQANLLSASPPDEKAAPSAAGVSQAMLGAELEGDVIVMHEGKPVPGIEVLKVRAGGPAAKAGVREGDLIIKVMGLPARSTEEVDERLGKLAGGLKAPLEIFRDGKRTTVTVTLAAPPVGIAAKMGPTVPLGSAAPGSVPPATGSTGIFINGRELTPQQIQEIRMTYGFVAPPGRYWYDAKSGLWGVMGREAAGFLRPAHDFGPMPPNPSNGNTGVFINGREINTVEAMFCQQLFGAVYRGRWWLEGNTGYLGLEGNPTPVANVFLALQQAARSRQGGGGYSWHSNATGAYGGSDGQCSYVSIPGSGSVMTGNCD